MKTRYTIETHGHILITRVSGVTTQSILKRYATELQGLVRKFNGQDWACVLDLREWELGGPDISGISSDIHRWNLEHNMRCAVFLFDEEKQGIQAWALRNFVNSDQSLAFFHCADDLQAFEWLAAQGFEQT